MENNNIKQGWDYMCYALLAFGGLGLEVLLALLIEPLIYGSDMSQWSITQNVLHWIVTCILWGIMFYLLSKVSKSKMGFDLFQKGSAIKNWQLVAIGICFIFMLVLSYIDWNGWKIVKEYKANGTVKFIFQYIYYVFEAALFLLIIVFGQKAGETWIGNKAFPYGGIVIALTWGLVHMLTKGDVQAGLVSAVGGLVFGVVYLLTNQDIRKAFPIILIMFIL